MERMECMERLFVYGTLRRGYPHAKAEALATGAKWLGRGRMRAALFQLEGYPGLVVDRSEGWDAGSWVMGDVYALGVGESGDGLLRELDRYEGSEYRRAKRVVWAMSGLGAKSVPKELRCWVYVYQASVRGRELVAGGDYFPDASL